MGTIADRNKGISYFVRVILQKQGLALFEKWFDHLQKLTPNQEVAGSEVRDKILEEILSLVTKGDHIVLSKKDEIFIQELLNRYLMRFHLLEID